MSNKTEKPSRKRLRDARSRGDALKSKEVTSAAGFVVLTVAIAGMLPWLLARVERLFALVWSDQVMKSAADSWPDVLLAIGKELVDICIPLALIAAAGTSIAAFIQVRGIFSADPVTPKLSRIDPAAGLKSLFSSHNVLNLFKLMLRLLLMSTVVVWIIIAEMDAIMRLMYGTPSRSSESGAKMLLMLFAAVAGLYIVFAAIDYLHQYYEYMKKLRMSKDEIKREHKDIDGNPQVKNARRRLARELAFSTPGDATRKASVLVVNPTHFAVALFYEPGATELPLIVEKATDDNALFLRSVARDAGVPIFEYPLLARELFRKSEVFTYVPQDLFPAVAEVLNWVRSIQNNGAPLPTGSSRHNEA